MSLVPAPTSLLKPLLTPQPTPLPTLISLIDLCGDDDGSGGSDGDSGFCDGSGDVGDSDDVVIVLRFVVVKIQGLHDDGNSDVPFAGRDSRSVLIDRDDRVVPGGLL